MIYVIGQQLVFHNKSSSTLHVIILQLCCASVEAAADLRALTTLQKSSRRVDKCSAPYPPRRFGRFAT